MRLLLTLLFVAVVPNVCHSADSESVYAGIRTRSACVENLKGLGSSSLIFDAPTKSGNAESTASNEEFNWDAQLVTIAGQIVRVQLHCVQTKLPAQPDKKIANPSLGYMSELVRL